MSRTWPFFLKRPQPQDGVLADIRAIPSRKRRRPNHHHQWSPTHTKRHGFFFMRFHDWVNIGEWTGIFWRPWRWHSVDYEWLTHMAVTQCRPYKNIFRDGGRRDFRGIPPTQKEARWCQGKGGLKEAVFEAFAPLLLLPEKVFLVIHTFDSLPYHSLATGALWGRLWGLCLKKSFLSFEAASKRRPQNIIIWGGLKGPPQKKFFYYFRPPQRGGLKEHL